MLLRTMSMQQLNAATYFNVADCGSCGFTSPSECCSATPQESQTWTVSSGGIEIAWSMFTLALAAMTFSPPACHEQINKQMRTWTRLILLTCDYWRDGVSFGVKAEENNGEVLSDWVHCSTSWCCAQSPRRLWAHIILACWILDYGAALDLVLKLEIVVVRS